MSLTYKAEAELHDLLSCMFGKKRGKPLKNVRCSSEANTNTGSVIGLVSSKNGRILVNQDRAEYIIVSTANNIQRRVKYQAKQSDDSV